MKCSRCGKNLDLTNALHCENCGKTYCGSCAKENSLCKCNGELVYYS